jgi:Ca-activated chloride channel homolog
MYDTTRYRGGVEDAIMMLRPILDWWWLVAIAIVPVVFMILFAVRAPSKPLRHAWLRRFVLVLLILVIALRPSLPGASRSTGTALLDVYFVVDTTTSARAEDYNGTKTRLEGMRQDMKDIAAKLAGARYTLIVFNNDAHVELPLTSDASALGAVADTLLTVSSYNGAGSSIDMPLDITKSELMRGQKQTPDRGRVLFYLGDGEQTAKSSPKSFAALAPLVAGGAVLGYGTTQGGRMQEDNWGGSINYIRYYGDGYSGENYAMSKIDESNLQTIAKDVNLRYFHRTEPGNIDAIISGINIGGIISKSRDSTTFEDYYWVAAIPATLLIAWDGWALYVVSRQMRMAREKVSEL